MSDEAPVTRWTAALGWVGLVGLLAWQEFYVEYDYAFPTPWWFRVPMTIALGLALLVFALECLMQEMTVRRWAVSLVVFAEGGRTMDGKVRPFQDGIFRMIRQLQYPIVPMSVVGSFEFHRKGSRMLYPSKIVVHLHDSIETKGLDLDKDQVEALREKVQAIVSAPIDAALGKRQES